MYLLSTIGGIVAIPIALFIVSLICFYKGHKQWVSGTIITTMPRDGGPVTRTESKARKSWFQIGANIFGLICLGASIGIYIWMWLEK